MTAVSEVTKTKALNALEGMRGIVRREMLVTGDYVEQEVTSQRLAEQGSICGGRKHCAIGSLWVGAGVKHVCHSNGVIVLPGVAEYQREGFLRRRHGLRLALGALNEAATEYAMKHGLKGETGFDDSIEDLFESHYGDDLDKTDLLKVIAAAKRKVVSR